jgi:hypothetical protein
MSNIVNIHEYKKFKKIIKEVPELLILLEKLQSQLYDYMHYQAAENINYEINLAKENLEMNLQLVHKKLKQIEKEIKK